MISMQFLKNVLKKLFLVFLNELQDEYKLNSLLILLLFVFIFVFVSIVNACRYEVLGEYIVDKNVCFFDLILIKFFARLKNNCINLILKINE